MTNTPLKYFCEIMLGFPAAAVSGKSCLAQNQTLVAKKRTLESKLIDLTPGLAFFGTRVCFCATRVCFYAKQLFPATAAADKPSIIFQKYFKGVFVIRIRNFWALIDFECTLPLKTYFISPKFLSLKWEYFRPQSYVKYFFCGKVVHSLLSKLSH